MTIEVDGITETLYEMRRTQTRLPKRSLDTMRRYQKKMVRRAKAYAYRKTGALENSIVEFAEEKVGGRTVVAWGVDEELLGENAVENGVRYDIELETGNYNLGPKSIQKDQNSDHNVGPGFMMRALWDFEGDLMRDLRKQAKKR